MITVLSPAKTLDYDSPVAIEAYTVPPFLERTQELVDILKDYGPKKIKKLMKVSDKLAELNAGRFENFELPTEPSKNARQALLAFKGDVYRDFQLNKYREEDYDFAQQHVRILSGLYGVLRPLDLMAPYRLEMGTRLKTKRGNNLYEFWGTEIAQQLNEAVDAQGDNIVLNLASTEYFSSVDRSALTAQIISVAFLEERNGQWKPISFNLKRARGTMTDWIVRNRIDDPEDVKDFAEDRYYFSAPRSSKQELVFLRRAA